MSECAVVTGASSGIGRAFAVELARRGWRVVVVARDEGRLAALARELNGEHEVLAADLATAAGCDAVARRIDDDERPVTLFVHAAGIGTAQSFPRAPLDAEETQLALNVTSTLRLAHAAAHSMERRGRGAIMTIASTAAVWSTGTYAASKGWVVAATEGLAQSLAATPVRVVCVVPGFTRTEFHARSRVDNSGVRSFMWLTPQRVVDEALAALDEGRTICIPSRRYRVLVTVARLLPPRGRRALLRRLATLRPAD